MKWNEMISFVNNIPACFKRYLKEEQATAFTETVILMPLLVTLLMGVYDMGRGITTNQKIIGSAQIIGDLIARNRSLMLADVNEIIIAGELALQPYPTEPWGYDIVSLSFDAMGNPFVEWRITENTIENDAAVDSTVNLGEPGEGVIVVTSTYRYRPFFSSFIFDEINMQEVAFLRGRRSPVVECPDCPVP